MTTEEIAAKRLKVAARKKRRESRVLELAALKGELAVGTTPPGTTQDALGAPPARRALVRRVKTAARGVKRRKKRAKLRSWKSLVRAADVAFSLHIRARDPLSVFSGKPSECCFHIVTRSKHSVRWDPDNAVGATMGENYEMEFNPHKFIAALIAKRGLPWYEDLVSRSNQIAKRNRADMEEIIARFAPPRRGDGE